MRGDQLAANLEKLRSACYSIYNYLQANRPAALPPSFFEAVFGINALVKKITTQFEELEEERRSLTALAGMGQVINTWQPEYRWTGVDGATAYYLQVLRGSSTVLSVKVSAEKAGCTVAGSTCAYRAEKVLALGPYKWRVMAENPSGKSAWSVLVNFNTLPKPGVIATLGMPEGEINDHQPVYSWTKPDENATGFILEVWRGSSLVFRQWITPANAGCASDAGCDYKPSTTLVNGTYRWRVSGVNPSGAGPWSALKTFTVTSP